MINFSKTINKLNIPITLKNNRKRFLCFYDSEFNAYDDNRNIQIPQEIVSIGLIVVDEDGNKLEDFYSLVSLKAARRISNRCTSITGIRNQDMKKAISFDKVVKNLLKIISKYHLNTIYCYGTEDKKNFLKTNDLYNDKNGGKKIAKMFTDVRSEFKKKTRNKVGDQGLQFLKAVCRIEGDVKHNALSDAIDLSNVYYNIMNIGYDERLFIKLSKDREEVSNYKRSRRFKEENAMLVPSEIYKAKNKLTEFLDLYEIPNVNIGVKKALIDDLDILFLKK